MAFTDRFIKLPIQVFDRRMAEMTGREEGEESYMMMNPLEIVSYRPSWDKEDEDKKEVVSVLNKNGDCTLIYLTIQEFEQALNAHTK